MSKTGKRFYIALSVIFIIAIFLGIYFGSCKKGFYIDEYYSYTRANGTGIGISITPGGWNDTSHYIDELSNAPGESISFTQTYNNCGFHPPVYHYALHLISYLTPGVFSRWTGIGLNIAVLILLLMFVTRISLYCSNNTPHITLLAVLAVAVSPCIMTGVVFIRMYLLFALCTAWYLNIHLDLLDRDIITPPYLIFISIQIAICSFCGFLTMYYYVIIAFFISFVFAFYRFFILKKYKDTVLYGIIALVPFILAYIYFPSCIYFIFKRNKGQKVIGNLSKTDDIADRISFFYNMLNRHVFGGLLPVFIFLFIIGILITVLYIKKGHSLKELPSDIKAIILTASSSVFYYLLMTKITVKAGDTTNRYTLPVYPLFIILMIIGTYRLLNYLKNKPSFTFISKYTLAITVFLITLAISQAYFTGQVLYLYPEQALDTEYAAAHPDEKVVMFQRNDGQYDSQIQWLMKYPSVYFADADDLSSVNDEILKNADRLLVYIDRKADSDACLKSLTDQNPLLTESEKLWECPLTFDAYLIH